jgi:chaperonin GroES
MAKTKKTAKKKTVQKKTAKKVSKPAVRVKKALQKTPKKVAKKGTEKRTTQPAAMRKPVSTPLKKVNFSALLSPLEDRVLLQLEISGERRTQSGLILMSESANVAGHVKAQVVAVGPGKRNKKGQIRPLDLQIGDWVLLTEYAGDEVELNAVKLKIVREGEILGVVGNG